MIEAFRKIWYNGIIKKGDSLDLKVLIFDLVGSLTVDQIKILSIFDKEKRTYDISNIAAASEMSREYAKLLCLNLMGKGLLVSQDVNPYDKGRPRFFSMDESFSILLDYIK